MMKKLLTCFVLLVFFSLSFSTVFAYSGVENKAVIEVEKYSNFIKTIEIDIDVSGSFVKNPDCYSYAVGYADGARSTREMTDEEYNRILAAWFIMCVQVSVSGTIW